jgi:hypothetical protein
VHTSASRTTSTATSSVAAIASGVAPSTYIAAARLR